jgi:tetratricopeptide (TPR) repeat protein
MLRLVGLSLVLAALSLGCGSKDRNMAMTQMYSGLEAYEGGSTSQAIRELTRATETDPEYGMPYFYLGMIRLQEYDSPETAVIDLARAIDLLPDDDPHLADAYYQLGSAHSDLQHVAEGRAAFAAAVEHDSSHHRALYRLGLLLEANGDVMDAIDAYTRAINANPRFPLAYNKLGNIYALYEHYEPALAVFRNGFDNCQDPNNANDAGNMHLITGDVSSAIGAYRDAVERDADSITYTFNLGVAYAHLFRETADPRDRTQAEEYLGVAGERCERLGSQARCNQISMSLEELTESREEQE